MINKMITYLKGRNDDILTKELFVDIKDTYPLEYNTACKFYNASGIKSLKSSIRFMLNRSLEDMEQNETTKNQFESMVRVVEESYNNINFDTLRSVVGEMDERERNEKKDILRLIVKSLILLQLINNMNDIIDATNRNNGSFNYIVEHQNNLSGVITEHINDYIANEQIWCADIEGEIELVLDEIMSDEDARDIRKYHEDDMLRNDSSDVYRDDPDEDYDEFDKILNDHLDEVIDPNRLDRFVAQLLLKESILLKVIYNKILDAEFKSLPNVRYIIFIAIVLLLHITQKF